MTKNSIECVDGDFLPGIYELELVFFCPDQPISNHDYCNVEKCSRCTHCVRLFQLSW